MPVAATAGHGCNGTVTEAGPLYLEDRPGGDPVDDDYPIYLTTGRVVSQYLSGTQTRRIGGLVSDELVPAIPEIQPETVALLRFDADPVETVHRQGVVDPLTPRAALQHLSAV